MVPGIILAAGAASRMGRPKALLAADRGGTTFVRRLAQALYEGGCAEVIVVVGHEADEVVADLEKTDVPVRAVLNPRWRDGQLSSLLAGLDVVDRPGVRAIAVALVDAPLVRAATVAALLAVHRERGAPIVRPEHGGRHGHPVIFDRRLFAALRQADPAQGAKSVVRAYADQIAAVEIDDEGAYHDIDTPDDYARIVTSRVSGT